MSTRTYRARRTRIGAALLSAGIGTMATGGVLLVGGQAAADPGGNNGTVKIAGQDAGQSHDNTPHVGCVFDIEWWGFDTNAITQVSFTLQAPSSGNLGVSGDLTPPLEQDPAKGGDLDGTSSYTLSYDGALHPQGFHVKVQVDTTDSRGSQSKFKTFWVSDCGTEPSPSPTTPTPTESPLPTESEEPSPTESEEPSPTESEEPSPTESESPSGTVSPTESEEPSPTESEEPSPTESESPSGTVSPTESEEPSPTQSEEPSPTESEEPSPSGTVSPTETEQPSPTESESQSPSGTVSPTESAEPSDTGSPSNPAEVPTSVDAGLAGPTDANDRPARMLLGGGGMLTLLGAAIAYAGRYRGDHAH